MKIPVYAPTPLLPLGPREDGLHFAGEETGEVEQAIRLYLGNNYEKLSALGVLMATVPWNGTLVSFGAGEAVLETVFSRVSPSSLNIVAVDSDPEVVARVRRLFPQIQALPFDFRCEDVGALLRRFPPVQAAVFFGSSYVLDDLEFVRMFRGLTSVPIVLDFYPAYLGSGARGAAQGVKHVLCTHPTLRWLFRRPPLGRPHGFSRTRGALRRLYREAGFVVEKELATGPYRYAVILKSKGGNA